MIIRAIRKPGLFMGLAVGWLLLSMALAIWWLVFALEQASQLAQIHPDIASELTRKHRMIVSEGLFLVLLLLVGGASLVYLIWTEFSRSKRLKEFFAAFTHDLKTSLASVRLQAESLAEDLENEKQVGGNHLLRRLLKDTGRLELQLENSLLVSTTEFDAQLLVERVNVNDIINSIRADFPDLNIALNWETTPREVRGDKRAMTSIFRNLCANALRHGKATELVIEVSRGMRDDLVFNINDNGAGFSGGRTGLGDEVARVTTSSGSGLGLYLVKSLTARMKGQVEFLDGAGFRIRLHLPVYAKGAPA